MYVFKKFKISPDKDEMKKKLDEAPDLSESEEADSKLSAWLLKAQKINSSDDWTESDWIGI